MRFFKALWDRFYEWRKQRAMDRVWDDFRNGRAYFTVTVDGEYGQKVKTFINSKGDRVQFCIPDGVDEAEIDFGDPFDEENDDEPTFDPRGGLLDGEGTAEGDSELSD